MSNDDGRRGERGGPAGEHQDGGDHRALSPPRPAATGAPVAGADAVDVTVAPAEEEEEAAGKEDAAFAAAPRQGQERDGDGDNVPNPKRAKVLDDTNDDKTAFEVSDYVSRDAILNRRGEFADQFARAQPYKHCLLPNLFDPPAFLDACLREIKTNSKVNFKESDLFKVYQSIDLANLRDGEVLANAMPNVMKLRHVLYSREWRRFIEDVAGLEPNTLTTQVDCACNCHAPSCHLLCHDDVIGTRKISYILYLTDPEPEWQPSEGGALELYDSKKATATTTDVDDGDSNGSKSQRVPETIPCKQILPCFNSMAFFVVDPGVSFHAVQEVCGSRPRLSLQGWYHCSSLPENIHNATLQHLKQTKKVTQSRNSGKEEDEEFEPYPPEEEVEKEESGGETGDSSTLLLSERDRVYLSEYVDDTYLQEGALRELKDCFESESSVQLRHFLKDEWVDKIRCCGGRASTSTSKDFDEEDDRTLSIDHPDFYKEGVSAQWELIGPPHMQRYLRYRPDISASTEGSDDDGLSSAGEVLQELRTRLLQSHPFRRFLRAVTSLGEPTGYTAEIRRFRPGRDYTVAHYGLLRDTSVLDATLCFVAGSGKADATMAEPTEDNDNGAGDKTAAAPSDVTVEPDEADILWQSGDVGGFECYIAADDDDDADQDDSEGAAKGSASRSGSNKKGPADEYNEDDDTELLSVSASNNTLNLVYRDPGTMRFVKYLSKNAPSSRYDIAMEYQVVDDDDENDDNGGEEEEGSVDANGDV